LENFISKIWIGFGIRIFGMGALKKGIFSLFLKGVGKRMPLFPFWGSPRFFKKDWKVGKNF